MFNVILTVTDNKGCINDTTIAVKVNNNPSPSFTIATPCIGQISVFSPHTSFPACNNWNWNFGNNNDTSNLQFPQYSYSHSGNYNIKLSVSDVNGCKGDTIQTVFISPLPIADFSFDTVCSGESTLFTDQSIDSNYAISNWSWNFGDNTYSNQVNPTHTYNNPNAYQVVLQIMNNFGCFDTISHLIIVDTNSIAGFSANTVTIGSATVFNGISNTNSPGIINWSWDFGDGNFSTLNHPIHTYAVTDTFYVSLAVVNTYGCKDTLVQNVIVYPLLTVDFTVEAVCLGNTSYFTDHSFSPGGNIVSWNWNFGDGNTSNLQNPIHQYNTAGNYTVWLTIMDINGNRDSISHIAFVHANPVALFYSDTVCSGDTTHFSTISVSNGAAINSWKWNFGEGSLISLLENPSHLYTTIYATTTYTVSLIVSDSLGCNDTAMNQLVVYPPVVADFISDTVCSNTAVNLTDISVSAFGSITDWIWNFGNASSTLKNPVYSFSNILNDTVFNIKLLVTDAMGCKYSVSHPLLVHPQPVVLIKSDTVCAGLTTHFMDASYSNGGG